MKVKIQNQGMLIFRDLRRKLTYGTFFVPNLKGVSSKRLIPQAEFQKTKVITQDIDKGHRQPSEPIKAQSTNV